MRLVFFNGFLVASGSSVGGCANMLHMLAHRTYIVILLPVIMYLISCKRFFIGYCFILLPVELIVLYIGCYLIVL